MRRLKILTWLTHGSYLYYLSQLPHDFHLMMQPGRPPGFGGRTGTLRWGDNVFDQPVESARRGEFDCILFQDDHQFFDDQFRWLSPAQRALPKIYIEHDPPREHPTDTRHPVDDPQVLLVHVTPFNALMWDNGRTPVRVVEHGVIDPGAGWQGELARGITVINHLERRGRRLGADLFAHAREQVPLDLLGMGSEALGGLGEAPLHQIPALCARYRFFFHPVRYTSLGLGLIEAMMLGMPIVGLTTTEMPNVIENGISGYTDTDPARLVDRMRELIRHHRVAAQLGARARERALERYSIGRSVRDWNAVLAEVAG
jgi:hypothetical protein